MTYTENEKRIIKDMREHGDSWESISIAVNKPAGNIRTWYSRNRLLLDLPPKVKVAKKVTDGRVGLQIKKLLVETPTISVRDLQSKLSSTLSSSFSPSMPCPSVTSCHNNLMLNKLKVIKLLKKPLISLRNMEKRLKFAS
jgi:hypothetical protein